MVKSEAPLSETVRRELDYFMWQITDPGCAVSVSVVQLPEGKVCLSYLSGSLTLDGRGEVTVRADCFVQGATLGNIGLAFSEKGLRVKLEHPDQDDSSP